jgi:hypothetical protein
MHNLVCYYRSLIVTQSQRRRQNQKNAMRSTGPTSECGKARSRQNAVTHGFTAVELFSLPNENPETLQTEADAWFETLEPDGRHEEFLVNRAAFAALQLHRFAKAEAAIVADQVRGAEPLWDREHERQFHDGKKLLFTDPGTASIELKSSGKGVVWLLREWITLDDALKAGGCWNNAEVIRHALRLQGFDAKNIALDDQAQEFAARAVACIVDPAKKASAKAKLSDDGLIRHRYKCTHESWESYDREESLQRIRNVVIREMNLLVKLSEVLEVSETASRASAGLRAMVLEDTPRNSLLIRYSKSIESGFDRTIKTLMKLKQDREEKAANEAEEEEFRNEPEEGPESSPRPIEKGSCVMVNGTKYAVHDKTDAMLSLALEGYVPKKYESVDATVVSEDVSTPSNGV